VTPAIFSEYDIWSLGTMGVSDVQAVTSREDHRPRFFGPGLVSAASDNDPTTVASLAVVGATTGYALCWLVVLLIPMLAIVQAMAAAVGGVCATSLQGAIVRRFGLSWAVATLCAVVAVNVITLVADVKAGGEAMALLTRIPANFFILPFVLGAGWLLVSHSYARIERLLTLLPLVFVCYVASAIMAHFDTRAFLHSIFAPHITLSMPYVSGAIALLGTTLTSYVYVWESVEVAERRPLRSSLRAFKLDAVFGMLVVGVIFLFIVLASATTLGRYHLPIATASDIAAALTPLAGPWAGMLFGVGLLGSAILVVPILASTSAYVMSHTFGWSGSLDAKVGEAKAFYGVILGSLAIAAAVAFAPVSPIAVLYWASIAGGLATPLTLFFLVRVARDAHIMGPHRIGPLFAASAWVVTGVVTIAAAAFLLMEIHHA
jgi:Mn2+/Fe2+ NRAMP family transporter